MMDRYCETCPTLLESDGRCARCDAEGPGTSTWEKVDGVPADPSDALFSLRVSWLTFKHAAAVLPLPIWIVWVVLAGTAHLESRLGLDPRDTAPEGPSPVFSLHMAICITMLVGIIVRGQGALRRDPSGATAFAMSTLLPTALSFGVNLFSMAASDWIWAGGTLSGADVGENVLFLGYLVALSVLIFSSAHGAIRTLHPSSGTVSRVARGSIMLICVGMQFLVHGWLSLIGWFTSNDRGLKTLVFGTFATEDGTRASVTACLVGALCLAAYVGPSDVPRYGWADLPRFRAYYARRALWHAMMFFLPTVITLVADPTALQMGAWTTNHRWGYTLGSWMLPFLLVNIIPALLVYHQLQEPPPPEVAHMLTSQQGRCPPALTRKDEASNSTANATTG